MRIDVILGDVFEQSGDVLICPANPQLNMSGGVNGEILRRGGESIQQELRRYMSERKASNISPGTVVMTSAGPLRFQNVIHAVAIDAFYQTDEALVSRTLIAAWQLAAQHRRKKVVMSLLGTGYGGLPIEDFVRAFHNAAAKVVNLPLSLTLVVRDADSLSLMTGATA